MSEPASKSLKYCTKRRFELRKFQNVSRTFDVRTFVAALFASTRMHANPTPFLGQSVISVLCPRLSASVFLLLRTLFIVSYRQCIRCRRVGRFLSNGDGTGNDDGTACMAHRVPPWQNCRGVHGARVLLEVTAHQPLNGFRRHSATRTTVPLNCIVTECLQKCIRSTLPLCCHKHESINQSVDQLLDPQRHERNVMNIKRRREKKHRNINYFNHTYIDYNMLFLSGNSQQFHPLFFVLFFFFFLFSKYYTCTSLLVSIGLS